MKSVTKTSLALIVVAAVSWLSGALHAVDTEQDKKEVQRVLERYLESVKNADVSLTAWPFFLLTRTVRGLSASTPCSTLDATDTG